MAGATRALGATTPQPAAMALLVAAAVGCGSAPPPPVSGPTSPPLGSLLTLVPEGTSTVLVVRPTQLLEAPATGRVLRALFSSEQLDRFASRTGIDPRALAEIVVAFHSEGRVVFARGPVDAGFAVREAGQRMAPLESSADEPLVRRAGFLGSSRTELVALSEDVVARIDGSPQLTAAVLASWERTEDEREHPFTRGVRASLRAEVEGAPFAVVAPEPLSLPRDTGLGMLLARERALVATARQASEDDSLSVRVELRGEFPSSAADNFRTFAESVAQSDLGAAIGARDALPTLRVAASGSTVVLTAQVEAGVLASGLRALLVAEMEELLEGRDAEARGSAVGPQGPGAGYGAGDGSGTGAGTEPGGGAGSGAGTEPEPRAGAGSGAGTERGAGAGAAGTCSGTGAETEPGAGAGVEAGAGAGTAETCSGTGAETEPGAGAEAGTGTEAEAGPGSGTGTEVEPRTAGVEPGGDGG